MRLKLYCNRYEHFKDALVCSVNCVYRTRCADFALFYDAHRGETDKLVADYFAAQREAQRPARPLPLAPVETADKLRSLIRLEVKQEMAEAVYIWIGSDERAELIEHEEVLRRAERGKKPQHIYKVSQEMELRFQLVPRKRIEKAKRAAEVQDARAVARRARKTAKTDSAERPAAPPPAPAIETPAAAPRRARARSARAPREK